MSNATINNLSSLLTHIMGNSLIWTDRGNGCGGPGYMDAKDALDEIESDERHDMHLDAVAEADDSEAWDLARDAFRAVGLDPADLQMVLVTRRGQASEHQTVYAA